MPASTKDSHKKGQAAERPAPVLGATEDRILYSAAPLSADVLEPVDVDSPDIGLDFASSNGFNWLDTESNSSNESLRPLFNSTFFELPPDIAEADALEPSFELIFVDS